MSSIGMDARSGIFGCAQSITGIVAFTSGDTGGGSWLVSSAAAEMHKHTPRHINRVRVFIATRTNNATKDRKAPAPSQLIIPDCRAARTISARSLFASLSCPAGKRYRGFTSCPGDNVPKISAEAVLYAYA